MAQILIKRSAVAAKVPASVDLALGELAINTYDGKLYLKKSVAGVETVIQVGDPATAPIQTVFGRTGSIVLTSADVTTALGFTPVQKTGDTMTGPLTATSFNGPLNGNANTATILATTRSISLYGDATWSVNFNGSANAAAGFTLANSGVAAGTYNSLTVDAKGRVTAATNISATAQLGYTPVNRIGDSMSGPLTMTGGAPVIYYDETDQTGTAGKWRLVADGGNWRIDQNTATARDFSSFTTGLQIASGGVVSAPAFSGPLTGAVTGNATTATTLATGRTLAVTGDLTWTSPAFNGSSNVTAVGTLASTGVTAGTYTKLTIDAKGRALAGLQLTANDVTTALGYIPASNSEAGTPGGAATLDGNGKLLASQIPAIAISDTFVVASQAAMLALSGADIGDVAVRTDLSKSFILKASGYATLANWQELMTPVDSVQSVAGRTGVITLTVADISGTMPVAKGGTGVTTSTGTGNAVLSNAPALTGAATLNGSGISAINPATPKDGDVQVAAGPTISIYASGAWRQIFPAVYS
jgi:hypothetical protein